MSNQSQNNSLISSLLLVTGGIIGAACVWLYKENQPKHAGVVLQQVRNHLNQQDTGNIEGSWIDYDPIEYTVFDSCPLVYIGGFTRLEDGVLHHYQFACDVYTGDIIDLFEYSPK